MESTFPEPHHSASGAGQSPESALLTLQEAADRLKVHYMTAYRWVRKGELPAFKTGGRLRVRESDLVAFVERREVDTALPRAGQRTDWATHEERLHKLLRQGESTKAQHMVRKIVADGAPAGDVYVRLLAPALRRIGDDWSAQRICVAEEHRATEIVNTILRRHSESFRRRGPRRGVAVTLTPDGEQHGLAITMVADFLRAGGYAVHHLGSSVPTDDLAVFLAETPADIVCVSVTNDDLDPGTYQGVVDAARAAVPGAVVVFGGQGVDEVAAGAAGGVVLHDVHRLIDHLHELAPA